MPEDVKLDLGMSSTRTTDTDMRDEVGTLQALNKVSFGIREQCKLITNLAYQMDDVASAETVLGNLKQFKQLPNIITWTKL